MDCQRAVTLVAGSALFILAAGVGCTAMLGIDKDYYVAAGGHGGAATTTTTTTNTHSGGSGGTGGTTPTGGGGASNLPNGDPCTNANQCEHDHCVDGVCCNESCTGTCKACTQALTGHDDGQCENVTAGLDPHQDCTLPELCNGSGDCRGGAPNGATCGADDECLSGNCPHNKVCCDTQCDSTCHSCEATYTGLAAGTCGHVLEGEDPYNQCSGSDTCNPDGDCPGGGQN